MHTHIIDITCKPIPKFTKIYLSCIVFFFLLFPKSFGILMKFYTKKFYFYSKITLCLRFNEDLSTGSSSLFLFAFTFIIFRPFHMCALLEEIPG